MTVAFVRHGARDPGPGGPAGGASLSCGHGLGRLGSEGILYIMQTVAVTLASWGRWPGTAQLSRVEHLQLHLH